MIKSICQNPFHIVIASSLLQRNRWCNVREYICRISQFPESHLKREASVFTITQLLLWSKQSSFWSDNISCNWKASLALSAWNLNPKDNPDQKGKKIVIMIMMITVNVMMRLVVVVTIIMIKIGENHVIWPAHETQTKILKNPGKFSKNPGIKNKGKSRPEKSRDPGIWKNPVPKIPGLTIWIPLGPDQEVVIGVAKSISHSQNSESYFHWNSYILKT